MKQHKKSKIFDKKDKEKAGLLLFIFGVAVFCESEKYFTSFLGMIIYVIGAYMYMNEGYTPKIRNTGGRKK